MLRPDRLWVSVHCRCCDCGDAMAWKQTGFCSKVREKREGEAEAEVGGGQGGREAGRSG